MNKMEDQREDSVVVDPKDDDTNWHFAGTTVHPFVRDTNHRMQLEIENRFVVLMVNPFSPSKKAEKKNDDENDDTDDVQHHEQQFLCFDATCYHMGAPLLHADIEDDVCSGNSFGSESNGSDASSSSSCVIVCPWHHYKIDVGKGGERVYFDAFTKERKTVARRQRTHEVKVDREENVWVKLNRESERYESDRYAFKQPLRSTRGKTNEHQFRAFKSSGDAFTSSSSKVKKSAVKEREEGKSLLGRMVGKSMSGGDGVAPWAISKEAGGGLPPSPARGILKKSSFGTSSSSKAESECIVKEEVFEDAIEEERVVADDE